MATMDGHELDLLGFNGDSMVIQWDLLGFNGDSIGFNVIYW